MAERTIYKYVAVIGIDGMGNFNTKTETPNLDKIFENGAVTNFGLSMDPTISAENWGAMLLGAEPIVHGLTNSKLSHNDHNSELLPSLFKRIYENIPNAKLYSYCNWNPINIGLIEKDIPVEKYTNGNDKELTDEVVKIVKEKPIFLFIHFDEADGSGHRNGYGTEKHLETIRYEDEQVARIFKAYEDAGIINETLFIAISDHGGFEHSHGGYSEGEKFIFFGARGKGIEKSEIKYMRTVDLYAIVLYALGIEIPEYNLKGFCSQVPEGLFLYYKGKYERIIGKPYHPEIKPTADYKAPNGLSSYISEERTKLALFFDNNTIDATGKNQVTSTVGTVKFYSEGVRGARVELGTNGHFVMDGFKFGSDSFTASLWIKIDRDLVDEPAIFANKNWSGRRCSRGVLLALRCSNTALNIGCGDDDFDFVTPFPPEISTGWVHAIYVVDKENRKVQTYYNFKLCHETELEPQYLVELDNLPFTVGNDALGTYNQEYNALYNIDDLFIFDGAFHNDEIEKLKEYYNFKD